MVGCRNFLFMSPVNLFSVILGKANNPLPACTPGDPQKEFPPRLRIHFVASPALEQTVLE
jgi:hypothetical protein